MAWRRAKQVALALVSASLLVHCGSLSEEHPVPCGLCAVREYRCTKPKSESVVLIIETTSAEGCRGRLLENGVELRCDGQLCTDGYGCESIVVTDAGFTFAGATCVAADS